MIQPIELKETRAVTLPDGSVSTTDDVWSMLVASRDGDLDRMKALAAGCPGLIRCEYNYTPPLHFAVREGHLDVVRYLLGQGIDPTYRTYPFQDSLLTMAQDRGHHEIARLLEEQLSSRFALKEGIGAFLKAARDGDLAQVQSGLARDPSLARASNETGDTALHQAATGCHLHVVMALLDSDASIDAVRSDGCRPVHCALRQRRHFPSLAGVVAGVLIGRAAQYNIYLAAAIGDEDYVAEALEQDVALANFEETCHERPVSAAARRNDMEMVKLLLEHGADPSLAEEGAPLGTALWIAVYQKQAEMAKLLLEHEANPNASVESGGSVLLHARHDPELTRLLIEHGAVDNSGDLGHFQRSVSDHDLAEVERLLNERPDLATSEAAFWWEGVLSGPANSADREMIELLIRYGARVPAVSKWGRYYYFKHYEIAALLMENGMNPNHMNWRHVTMLHDMAHEGNIPKARLLLDHGADINAMDEEYQSTPLGIACRWGKREMATFLLDRGADPTGAGAAWATPLEWARKKGHSEIEADLRSRLEGCSA